MQLKRKTAIVGLGLIVVVAAGAWYLSRPEPVPVSVAEVERGRVESTVTNTRAGTVKASRRANIAPLTSGQVTHLTVTEGDRVEAGQVLVELWNADRRAEVALAKSKAEAARARAAEACTKAEQAVREAARQETLQKKGLTSDEAVERATTQRATTRAGCEAARAETRVAREQVDVAQAALDKTRLTAPFDGVVAEVNAELGEIVTPSPTGIPTPPTVDLIDPSCPYVSAPIDEVDAPQIEPGMPARISLDAFGEQTFEGRVQRVAPYVLDVEKQARTVEVEVVFSDPDAVDGLLPGYSADAIIILESHADTLRVPSEAVLEDQRVLVVDEDGIIRERSIESGLRNWDFTEVTDGLAVGDRVVLSVNRDGVVPGVPAVVEDADKATR